LGSEAAEEVELERAAAACRVGGGGKPWSAEEDPSMTTMRPSVLLEREKGKSRLASERLRLEDDRRWTSCRQMGLVFICSTFSREMREMVLPTDRFPRVPLSVFFFSLPSPYEPVPYIVDHRFKISNRKSEL
jgi:hypothetical protein